MGNAKAALIWITDILKDLGVPFQIAGGLAARVYGATRELVDIDIDIPEVEFDRVKYMTQKYITFGPKNFKSEEWNLLLMTLNYEGQDIDLSGAYNTKVYNKALQRWENLTTDFNQTEKRNVFGLQLPIIPCHLLLAYKRILSREVDLIDIHEIQNRF